MMGEVREANVPSGKLKNAVLGYPTSGIGRNLHDLIAVPCQGAERIRLRCIQLGKEISMCGCRSWNGQRVSGAGPN
jgi:hypothetical protein